MFGTAVFGLSFLFSLIAKGSEPPIAPGGPSGFRLSQRVDEEFGHLADLLRRVTRQPSAGENAELVTGLSIVPV